MAIMGQPEGIAPIAVNDLPADSANEAEGLGGQPETDERPETETETANGGRRKIRPDKTEANPTETRYR